MAIKRTKPLNNIQQYVSHKIALNSAYGTMLLGGSSVGKSTILRYYKQWWTLKTGLRVVLNGDLVSVNLDGRTKWDLIKWCRQRFGPQDTKMKRKGWNFNPDKNELLLPENVELTEFKLTWL